MSAIRLKKGDAIIFQLVRRDLLATDEQKRQVWEEFKVVPLAVKPETMIYDYGTRSAIMQTEPDAGFIDKFGQKLARVTISGTFGVQPRRAGLSFKDGYTRLLEFRDEVFKRSQQARSVKKDSIFGKKYGADDGGTNYIYGVNFYDFLHDEQFSINLDTLRIQASAQRNPIEPTYSITFTCIGDPLETKTKDPMLTVLLFTSSMIDSALSVIDSINTALANSLAGQAAGYGVAIYDTGVGLLDELTTVAAMYGNALKIPLPSALWLWAGAGAIAGVESISFVETNIDTSGNDSQFTSVKS